MRKLKLFLSLLMVMTLSLGNVWADEVTFAYGDYKGKGASSPGSEYTMEKTDVSIKSTTFYGNNTQAHFYANGTVTVTPASGVTITQIVLTATSSSYNGYQSNGTMTWSTGSSSADGAVVTWTGSATSAFTLSHNKQIRWTSIVVTYSKGGTPTCATPTFDPEDGTKFSETLDVEIACSTDGADVYYTLDGTDPTSNSTKYTSAISLSETKTIKAIAIKEGANNSSIASATYTKAAIVNGYDVDFESDLDLYADWTFVNLVKDNTITAHGGSYFANTDGKGTATATTKTKIANPGILTFYISKKGTNTNENSKWSAQVSSNGTDWTIVGAENAAGVGVTEGNWNECTADLSEYNDVYVRVNYKGTTAVRCIDDISLQMAATKYDITISDAIEHGSVEASVSTAAAGTEVTLTATPDAHCAFVAWDVKQGETPVTVTNNKFEMPEGNVTVSATFAEIKNAVTFAAPTGGTLSILNGEEAVATGAQVVEGTALTVTATPDAENHYIGGAIKVVKTSDESDVTASVLDGSTLTMPNYAITVSATFTPTYAINLVAEGGSIALDYTKGGAADGYAIAGTTIGAEATADDAHVFVSLAVSENVTEPTIVENLAEFVMPAEAVTITATFDAKTTPTISVSKDAIAFEPVAYSGELAAQTFNVSGVALAAGKLTIASNNEAFTVSPVEIDVDGALAETEITVTPRTTICGTFNGKITISGGNADAKEVAVSLTVNKLPANLAWNAAEATVTINADDNVFPTLTNPNSLAVTYSSTNTDAATISNEEGHEGEISLVAAGSTTIKANFAGSDIYLEQEVTYTLNIQKKYTAKWFVNGEELTESTQNAVAGTDLEFPSDPTKLSDDCADMVFKGWAEAAIEGKQDDAPTYTTKTQMPEANVNFYAVFATENEDINSVEYQYTIPVSDFNTTSYAANNNEKTVNAVCTTDESKKLEVKYTSNQVMQSGSLIQGQKSAGYIYNAAAWGSKVKSITINDNVEYTYVIGASAQPTETAEGAFFKISAGSATSKASSIDIVFEVSNKSVTYTDYLTTCPSCPKVTLEATEAANGTVELSSYLVQTCEAAEVTVTTTPSTGYELSNIAISELSGASISGNTISLEAETAGELTVTATFTKINYTVTMAQDGGAGATISGDQTDKHYGDEITVTANEPTGYVFLGWEASPAVTFADAKALETTFNLPNSNVTVTAKYAKLYTVAEAKELADGTKNVAISGIISQLQSVDPEKYVRAQYFISDNGNTDNQFLVYNGYYVDGANVTSHEQIVVGDKVIVFGNIGSYNEVTQVAANNYMLSSVHLSSIAIDDAAAAKTYEAGDEFELSKVTVSATYADESVLDVTSWAEKSADPVTIAASTTEVALTASWCGKNANKNVAVTVNTHQVSIDSNYEHGTVKVTLDAEGEGADCADEYFVKGTTLYVIATPEEGYKVASIKIAENASERTLEGNSFEIGTSDVTVIVSFSEDGGGTAVDNTEVGEKVVKSMENGVLIIRRGDKTYNGQGQLVK